jgi:MFS family permease
MTASAPPTAPSADLRIVAQIAVATTLLVTGFAMVGPIAAVLLQSRGVSPVQIGAFAMIPFVMVALLLPVMPQLFARFGVGRAYLAGLVLEMPAIPTYALTDSYALWCAASAVSGAGAAAAWNATEALIAQYSPPAQRGRITALYQTALGAALAVGPFLPGLTGWGAGALFAVAFGFHVLAVGITALLPLRQLSVTRDAATPSGQVGAPPRSPSGTNRTARPLTTWGAVGLAPALVTIAFVGGVYEMGLTSITAANGAAMGLSLAAAAAVAGAIGVGSFVGQLPAGLAADRASSRAVFVTSGGLLAAAALALGVGAALAASPAEVPTWLLATVGLVWGGVGGALYTLTMIRVAHQFADTSAAAGTAAMISGYTLGGAFGPPVSGSLLQLGGLVALAGFLGLLSLVVVVLGARMRG